MVASSDPIQQERTSCLADAEETIVTNLLGPIRLTNALTAPLVRQPDAAVINVSSGLAFVPLSATPTYNATKAAIHSELTPGQSIREGYMPLDAFIDEAMGLVQRQPTPKEILVERVGFLRWAERDGRLDQAVEMLSAH
jgi:uncharacterized oxidoreductase